MAQIRNCLLHLFGFIILGMPDTNSSFYTVSYLNHSLVHNLTQEPDARITAGNGTFVAATGGPGKSMRFFVYYGISIFAGIIAAIDKCARDNA